MSWIEPTLLSSHEHIQEERNSSGCADESLKLNYRSLVEPTLPSSEEKMRTGHQVPYLDRWDVSKSFPMEY